MPRRVLCVVAVTRPAWLASPRMLTVVVVARLARCAWWPWLCSHAVCAAVGTAGASQQLLYQRRTPFLFYMAAALSVYSLI